MMNERDRIIHNAVWHMLGIAPLDQSHLDINRMLASLPPEEARTMRRKFRKLWRKLARKRMNTPGPGRGRRQFSTVVRLGLNTGAPSSTKEQEHEPSRRQKQNRKAEVFNEVHREIISPMKNGNPMNS